MASFKLVAINDEDPDNPIAYSDVYGPEYTKHFIVGMDEELDESVAYRSQYVIPEHHMFIKELMGRFPDDHPYWKLQDTNEDMVGETKNLVFTLDEDTREFLNRYTGYGKGYTVGTNWAFLRFLFDAGEILNTVGCKGMMAVLGQFLADHLPPLVKDDERNGKITSHIIYADMLAKPLKERVYVIHGLDTDEKIKNYIMSKPSFNDVIWAIYDLNERGIIKSHIWKLYEYIIQAGRNGPEKGPEIEYSVEELTEIVNKIIEERRAMDG